MIQSFANPTVPIPLPAPEDMVPLAVLAWGQNVPILEDRDERLCHQVVNLSGRPLTSHQLELLSLGLKFRSTPKAVPRLKTMAGIEGAYMDIARNDIDAAIWYRTEAARILNHSRMPKQNLSDDLRTAAKQLRLNSDIMVTSADKGGQTVVLLSEQYAEICSTHLEDDAYLCVDSFGTGRKKVAMVDPRTNRDRELLNSSFVFPDLTDRLLRLQCSQLVNLLKNLVATHDLHQSDLRQMSPQHPYSGVVPRFYGLPKLHKLGRLRIRPIISNYGLYSDKAMIHSKKILNLLPTHATSVLHSYQLADILDGFEFPKSAFMVLFDVASLFT